MAQEKIEILFKPKGDQQLINAIKQLDVVTKRLKGTTSKYEKELKDITRVQDKFNISTILGTKSLRNMGGNTLGLTRIISRFRSKLLLASFALGGFNILVRQRVDAFREQLQAEAALVSNLNNVSNASKDGAQSLIEYAAALQQVTTFGDEQIIQAASQLATYQLNEKAIASILPRLLDMTASTGTLEGNTIALGKAFTGQIGAISRYGVIIDKAQLEIARSKGAHEEFNFIIKELDKNYKGLSETLALTPIGQLDQMENQISDLNEELGRMGLPFLKQWTEVKKNLTEMATFVGLFFEEMQKRSGGSWLMGLLDSALIFGDLNEVFKKITKRFEEQKQLATDAGGAQTNYNNMVKTSAEQIAKYNKELNFTISSIQLTASQTEALTDIEAKQLIIKTKIAHVLKMYNEGLITFEEMTIKQNALIIEQTNLEMSAIEQKIVKYQEYQNAVMGISDSMLALNLQNIENSRQEALSAAESIRSERRKKAEIDKINQKYDNKVKKQKQAMQKVKVAEAISNTALAITKYHSEGKLALAILAGIQGAISIATIKAEKYQYGGLVGGRRHSQGGTMIEAERGEYVISRRGVDAIGIEALNRINAGQGGGSVNVTFAGNVLSKDFIEDEAIPQIKEAIRRGADIGVG